MERNAKQQKHVAERKAALNAAFEAHDEAMGAEYDASAELGREISCTCTHVLAEYFTEKAAELDAQKASTKPELLN